MVELQVVVLLLPDQREVQREPQEGLGVELLRDSLDQREVPFLGQQGVLAAALLLLDQREVLLLLAAALLLGVLLDQRQREVQREVLLDQREVQREVLFVLPVVFALHDKSL